MFEIFVFIENALSCPKFFVVVINDSRNFYFLSCFVSVVSLFFFHKIWRLLYQAICFISRDSYINIFNNIFYDNNHNIFYDINKFVQPEFVGLYEV